MKTENTNLVYFSATYTTRTVVRQLAAGLAGTKTEYDITGTDPGKDVSMGACDLLVVGMPVYSGRIPPVALQALSRFKGSGTPAIILCVYGNRDYDDALLELKDTVEGNGFRVVTAGAFIAQHSIFPKVGHSRPDAKDLELIKKFAAESATLLAAISDVSSLPDIKLTGNRPYKAPGKLPMHPKGDSKCIRCGTCVKLCPVQAIASDTPRETDKDKCISCGRCITVCPENARHFGGLIYKMAGTMFLKAFSARKEPTFVVSSEK